jgi:hypothetical protein
LSGKKRPPAPARTDIYERLEGSLKLPAGKLAGLADAQRKQELSKMIQSPPAPLFKEVRALLLEKCKAGRRGQVRSIFDKEPFGELERLITHNLMNVIKSLASEELGQESWLRTVARLSNRSYTQVRGAALEFLNSGIVKMTPERCVAFLDPLIVSWDIDLASFAFEIVLNRRIAPAHLKKFEFVGRESGEPSDETPGLREFLKDRSLRGDATTEEIDFLKKLRSPKGRRPTALYYYRELQNLRDPLHFRRK